MRTPEPQQDGLRRYRQWAGNPAGHKEDVTCCIASVPGEGIFISDRQCYRKRGHGPKGEYCKQHAKKAEAGARKR